MGLSSFSTFITLIRLDFEGRLHQALEMIRHPEIHGPVGDVLDLGWTREGELEEWIEASDRSWSAYEGVKRLLQRLRYYEEPIPEALARWSMDVAAGGPQAAKQGPPASFAKVPGRGHSEDHTEPDRRPFTAESENQDGDPGDGLPVGSRGTAPGV